MQPTVASRGAERQLRRRAHPRGFPILAMQVHGKPLVYLDNAASAQKPKAVLERLYRPIRRNTPTCIAACIISPMRRPMPTRPRASKVAEFLNAGRSEEIVSPAVPPRRSISWRRHSGASASRPGDEIVLSIMEHHANIVPWHFLRERQGAVIKWAPVDDDGNFSLEEFEKLMTTAPRWSR